MKVRMKNQGEDWNTNNGVKIEKLTKGHKITGHRTYIATLSSSRRQEQQ